MTSKSGDRRFFFPLLCAVTLLPYALFPVVAGATGAPADWLMRALTVVLFLGAGGHVAASFFYYGDRRMRGFMLAGHRNRYFYVPLAAVVGVGLVYQLMGPIGRAYFLVAFWCWQVHHFSRQNHGILSFASAAWGVPIHPGERLAITLTDVAAILATLCFVTPYRETVLADWGWHIHTVALCTYAAAWLAWASSRPWTRLRDAAPRELMVLILLAFYLPLFVFESAFLAVFVYLTAHCLQYLVFMGWVAKTPRETALRSVALLVTLTVAGGFLMQKLQDEGLWSPHGFTLLGVAYGITMWHFLLDAGVWRLSGAFQRDYMRQRFGFLSVRKAPTGATESGIE